MSLIFLSCGSDDSLTPIVINTTPDTVSVNQNGEIEILIFSNDSNIPIQGQLSITTPTKGIAIINDNGTSNTNDDTIIYNPISNIVGQDTFQYTICDASSSDTCVTETITVNIATLSVVNYNLDNFPYQNLSQYNFFEGALKDLEPTFGVLPYDLISPLFSDYAHKKRFIWMPNGVKATYENDHSPLNFPVGTILIKNFYFDNVQPENETRILETRVMYKKADEWDFAEYVWNNDQTEATLDEQGSIVSFDWIEDSETKSVNYRIPSRAECFTCHNKFGTPIPIGPKPQNLNRNYNYPDGINNQLHKLIELGYLDADGIPSNINTMVKWDDETQPLALRVRSYLDINCAHCHSEESYCEYRPMRLALKDNDQNINIGVCVEPDTQFIPDSNIITPGDVDLSILYYRINTTVEQFRMPLLGRTLKHAEGVRLIEEWIYSLNNNCN